MLKNQWAIQAAFLILSVLPGSGKEPADLTSYQEVNRLWIGLVEGIIAPHSFETVQAPLEGYYLFEARDGDWLTKDQHWLTIGPNKLELDKDELRLEQRKLEESRRLATIEDDENLTRLEERLEELDEQQRLLRESLANEAEVETLSLDLEERVQAGLAKLEKETSRVRDLMSEDLRKEKKDLTEKEQQLQLERKRLALIAAEKRSQIKSPFDGMLELSSEVKELLLKSSDSGNLIWLAPTTGIGTITDRRTYVVRVPSEGTQLESIPQEQVKIMISSAKEGKLVKADLLQVVQEQRSTEVTQIYEFQISQEEAKSLSVVGQQKTVAHLFQVFDKPCRVIPKRDIAFSDTTVLQSGGWGALVKKIWPGTELIAVGPQHLAVRIKE